MIMDEQDFQKIPYILYADRKGRIYEHPYFRMAGFSGLQPMPLKEEDFIPMPQFSKRLVLEICPLSIAQKKSI